MCSPSNAKPLETLLIRCKSKPQPLLSSNLHSAPSCALPGMWEIILLTSYAKILAGGFKNDSDSLSLNNFGFVLVRELLSSTMIPAPLEYFAVIQCFPIFSGRIT